MGYYTYYSLEMKNLGDTSISDVEIAKKLAQINPDYFSIADSLDDMISSNCMEWYYYEDNMVLLSEAFPNILFFLCGEGEDRYDMWIHYFRNGKEYKTFAEIAYEDCPEDLLT